MRYGHALQGVRIIFVDTKCRIGAGTHFKNHITGIVSLVTTGFELRQSRRSRSDVGSDEVLARLGVADFRLDAVPYLIERDGTSCERRAGDARGHSRFSQAIDLAYPARCCVAEGQSMARYVRAILERLRIPYGFPLSH